MTHATPDDFARLTDYLNGECSPEEARTVQQWIDEDPVRGTLANTLRAACQSLEMPDESVPIVDPQRAAEHVIRQIELDQPSRQQTAPFARPRPSKDPWLRGSRYGAMGAILGACLVVALWWGQNYSPWTNHHASTHVSVYTTGNGQQATITLSDGTTVLLNVASQLIVPVDYEHGDRTVHLRGEAFFHVSHQQRAPLTVIAGPSTTRVLGTSFLVRKYETDTAATIAVRDGKVSVGHTVLTAMRQVAVSSHGVNAVQPATPAQFSFVFAVLTFNDTPLLEAIPQLDRWYNADIRLGDSKLAQRRIVGGFKAGSLTDLVSALELMFNVHVVRDGRVLTLYQPQE
jgi:ferric-dicitrate binding protein FerR (iron transport regulator)